MTTPSSSKRGLLISSPRSGLTATGPSLVRMREFLGRQGFAIADDQCIDGAQATRAAILAGFAALIEATGPGDVIVVYYAGHGSLFRDEVGDVFRPHPLLEPMDIADSDGAHFNGLLGGELRLLIRVLARLCDNVTAIFDCCHASGLFTAEQPPHDVDEASDREALAAIAARAGKRIARRRDEATRGHDPTRSDREPERSGAVRLLASSASERAYTHDNQSMLLFTDILVTVLEEHALADGLSWEQIIREVRARVQELRPEQRPGVEGARDRRPFTTDVIPTPVDHFHVQREGQRLRLAAGTVAGIGPHDRFELLAYASDGPALGTARVQHVKPFHTFLEQPRSYPVQPAVMFARRLDATATELAARLATADLSAALGLQATLTGRAPRLREPVIADTPPGHVDLLDEQNPDGAPDFRPQLVARLALADPNRGDKLGRALRRLERWAGLAAQIGHPGLGPLTGCYSLTCGRLDRDTIIPLRPGAVLGPGEPLALHLYNPGRASVIHIQAYRVRADRCINAWRDVEGGHAVKTNHTFSLQETFERLPGLPGPQHEWLVVVIGDGAFDLGPLTTPPVDRSPPDVPRSPTRGPGEATRVQIFGLSYTLAAPS
jgi:hypothetical protein